MVTESMLNQQKIVDKQLLVRIVSNWAVWSLQLDMAPIFLSLGTRTTVVLNYTLV